MSLYAVQCQPTKFDEGEKDLTLLRAPDQTLDRVAFVVNDEDNRRDAGLDHGSNLLDRKCHRT